MSVGLKLFFDNFVKEHTTFLPYWAYLTYIFNKFKVDLASESNIIKSFEIFDHSVLLRMKLLKDPATQPPPRTQPLRASQSSTSHFDDAYYNFLNTQVLDLKTDQKQLLKNQSDIMDSLQSLTIKVDAIYDNQEERMRMFRNQFPLSSRSNMWSQHGVLLHMHEC